MSRYCLIFGLLTGFALTLVGCKGLSGNGERGDMSTDSVTIKSVALGDTACFPLTTGGKCDIYANAKISYPTAYKDSESTEELQKMFAEVVLEAGDSVKFNDSFKAYVDCILKQYGVNENERVEDAEDDYESVYQYANNIVIDVPYNKNRFLTFCKSETTIKNGNVTMSTHHFYNFDLEGMKYIELPELFSESAYEDLTVLIKQNLMKQLKVKSEDEVINLGYFNLDNLKVNNNFCIGDDGITWTYVPYEIALLSVGETHISVSYDDLEPYMLDNSIVSRLK